MKYFNLKLIIFFVFGTLITSCSDDNGGDQIIGPIIEDPTNNFTGNPFITTWETTVDNETINPFYLNLSGFDFTVDWGDGTTSHYDFNGGTSHTYETAGTYTVKLHGTYPRLRVLDDLKIKSVESWGDNEWDYMKGFFFGCENLVINATDAPDLSNVTNMSEMFVQVLSFNQEISGWDVSNVTNMDALFGGSGFNQDISSWDVSNVTNMDSMFFGTTNFDQPLSNWDVSNVTSMDSMFGNTTSFNQDISNWDVSNVIDMDGMFNSATSFNQDISNWDVSNVQKMLRMFLGAVDFNQNLSNWNTNNVDSCFEFSLNSGLNANNLPTNGLCF